MWPAFDPTTIPTTQHPKAQTFQGLWDTGATASVITQDVVDKCGLKPTGMTKVHGIHGAREMPTFLILLGLPNKVAFRDLRVTLGQLPGCDVLFGMDIISNGDFSITNHNGITACSFRVPSQHTLDYVAQDDALAKKLTRKKRDRHKSKRRPPGEPKRKRR